MSANYFDFHEIYSEKRNEKLFIDGELVLLFLLQSETKKAISQQEKWPLLNLFSKEIYPNPGILGMPSRATLPSSSSFISVAFAMALLKVNTK